VTRIGFRLRLLRIACRDGAIKRRWRRDLKRATQPSSPEETRAAAAREFTERRVQEDGAIETKRLLLMTRNLFDRSDRLMMTRPSPDEPGTWTRAPDDTMHLTRAGVERLREQVEALEKSRREARVSHFSATTTLVAAMASLVATVVALVSLVRN
jgi:hypothetical protein